jgi:hypothetical protein
MVYLTAKVALVGLKIHTSALAHIEIIIVADFDIFWYILKYNFMVCVQKYSVMCSYSYMCYIYSRGVQPANFSLQAPCKDANQLFRKIPVIE